MNQSTDVSKHCTGCDSTKAASEFHQSRSRKSGLAFYCKPCAADRSRAKRVANAVAISAKRKADYAANRERNRDEARRRYHANPHRTRVHAWRANGIAFTWDMYEQMRAAQGYACAVCDRHESTLTKALAVDHDHETGRVRGLLCDDCNLALGRFQDSPDVLSRAIEYLRTS